QQLVANGHDRASHAIVAGGANSALPHHHATHDTITRNPVLIDLGGTIDGYHSDLTRTFTVDEPDLELVTVHACVHAPAEAATAAVRPGAVAADIDNAARTIIRDAGYGPYFTPRLGHGIGLDVHEPPYLVAGDDTVLEPGMVFSIEPGIYLPDKFG